MDPQADSLLDSAIPLEDATPYDRSLKWTIHQRYYQERGNKAWLDGEVPFNITCNSAAARQNASLVYSAVEAMEQEGALSPTLPIRVLEVASGLGLFAINFIQAFKEMDRVKGNDFSKRLKYFFTDFSEKNLTDASANPTLKDLHAHGTVEFRVLNAMTPDVFRSLSSPTEEPVPALTAVIANYLHCCLPLSIIRKEGDHLLEKHIRLSLLVPLTTPNREEYARNFVSHPIERNIDNLQEEVIWKDLPEAFFDHPRHEEIIRDGTAQYPVATIEYPRGSFVSLERSLPTLLPGGIIVISDKGYSDSSYMEGEGACAPSFHGNSFAHGLNFPLLELLAKKLNCGTSRTSNPHYSLQTLLVEKRPFSLLSSLFRRLFVDENDNVASNDFNAAAWKFEETKQYPEAIRFYERALRLRPNDAHIHYCIGRCFSEQGDSERALRSFEAGQALDHFSEYNFAFMIGYVLHTLGKFAEALPHYRQSQEHKPSEITLGNIGLCFENLGETANALSSYQAALAMNPAYETARNALERLAR